MHDGGFESRYLISLISIPIPNAFVAKSSLRFPESDLKSVSIREDVQSVIPLWYISTTMCSWHLGVSVNALSPRKSWILINPILRAMRHLENTCTAPHQQCSMKFLNPHVSQEFHFPDLIHVFVWKSVLALWARNLDTFFWQMIIFFNELQTRPHHFDKPAERARTNSMGRSVQPSS